MKKPIDFHMHQWNSKTVTTLMLSGFNLIVNIDLMKNQPTLNSKVFERSLFLTINYNFREFEDYPTNLSMI